MPLTERQEQILRTVVEFYITTARPVGSAALVQSTRLGVSPATVRNEMAALEDMGYLRHLHTSGGRVPTSAGYRYYVERLMKPPRLSSKEEHTIRHQFHQAPTDFQEWLRLAAAVMAQRMHNVGLITTPRPAEVRLRHLEVIGIQETLALLIVVLQDGTVLQEMVTLPEVRTQDELSGLADRLNELLRSKTAGQIDEQASSLPPGDAAVAGMVSHLLHRAQERNTQVFHAGLAEMIRQPEFLQPRIGEPAAVTNERLRQMVEFLQHGFAVERLLANLPLAPDVQVVIGGEGEGLQDYSFVLGRYGGETDSRGYLGVVGPTRMEYPRAVALVRYMSDLMSDLMHLH